MIVILFGLNVILGNYFCQTIVVLKYHSEVLYKEHMFHISVCNDLFLLAT